MTIKTILDNLFGRVMKNGKRIPGTSILAFGTRIFFEDYLLPDDIIICTDWADYASVRMRRKYKHVEFISESEIKKIADKGTLYNYIERKYRMRKFDLVVSNPPYDGDLHLQILNMFLKISKQCVFVHPARWMEDVLAKYKAKSATGKKYANLKVALEKVCLIKMSDVRQSFNIGLDQDMLIGIYNEDDDNERLPIYKNPKMFFSIFDRILSYLGNNYEMSLEKHCDSDEINGIRIEIKGITPRGQHDEGCKTARARNSFVELTSSECFVNGKNAAGVYWWKARATNQYNKNIQMKMFPKSMKFDNINIANDFINLYNTNVIKNIVHMLKYDMNSCHTFIPYFDPKTIKTEDDVLNALGITEPEYRTWLKRDVYDYREKDFIKYNEWIDC